jgi:uncharacterized protein YdhG (YjbR/CyaY superfamily)
MARATKQEAFTADERDAVKTYVAERRTAASRKGEEKAAGEAQDLRDSIAKMTDSDRALAERVAAIVAEVAPDLAPKTWYGMPAYANADGKVVVFFQNGEKFKYRYCTLGFQDAANLDDGDMWPVAYALTDWSPEVEKRVVELVRAAVS